MTSREHRGDDAGEQVAGTAAREHGAAERNMDHAGPIGDAGQRAFEHDDGLRLARIGAGRWDGGIASAETFEFAGVRQENAYFRTLRGDDHHRAERVGIEDEVGGATGGDRADKLGRFLAHTRADEQHILVGEQCPDLLQVGRSEASIAFGAESAPHRFGIGDGRFRADGFRQAGRDEGHAGT